jgi:hypothetical protein
MATLKELSEVGVKLGFNRTDLHDYIKAEQDRAGEDSMKDRMMLRELEGEKLELEHKHKLELIATGGDKQVIRLRS